MRTKYYTQLILLVVATLVQQAVANCNVCRNGGQITNPSHSFTMRANGQSLQWTCAFLQESVADVLSSGGAPGEAQLCSLAQLWADLECQCSGDPVEDPDNVYSPNPACDMCGGDNVDFPYVPAPLAGELVDTGIYGRMNCGGFYEALQCGLIPANRCVEMQDVAGPVCCTVPELNIPQAAPTPPPGPSCGAAFTNCESQSDCCTGLDCKLRIIGSPKVCSARPRTSRTSLARPGAGGAAGAAKNNN